MKDGDILPGDKVRATRGPFTGEVATVHAIYIRKNGTFGYTLDYGSAHMPSVSIRDLTKEEQ